MDKSQVQEVADIADALTRFSHSLPDDSTDIGPRIERVLCFLLSLLETLILEGTNDINPLLFPLLARCKTVVVRIKGISDDITTASSPVSNHPYVSPYEGDRLSAVFEELCDSTNVLSVAMHYAPSLDSPSSLSQAEVHKAQFDGMAKYVLHGSSQFFPSIEHRTTGHAGLTVEEIVLIADDQRRDARVCVNVCPKARICRSSKLLTRKVKFRCCCDNAPHDSQLNYQVIRGESLLREEIVLEGSRQWSILLLRSGTPLIVRLSNVPLLYRGRVQELADRIGMTYLTDLDGCETQRTPELHTWGFECFRSDWRFPSIEVRAITYNSGGVKRSLDTLSSGMLKHDSVVPTFSTIKFPHPRTLRYRFPEPYFRLILRRSPTDKGGKEVLVTFQTQVSHQDNPLGRLYVSLANVIIVGVGSDGGREEDCKVDFGFRRRDEAESFANYLKVAQNTLFEGFMQGPLSDETVIYDRDLYIPSVDAMPVRLQFTVISRKLEASKHVLRAIVTQYGAARCICLDLGSKVSQVMQSDLLQSSIWVLNHDANGKPYASHTNWETPTGTRVLKPIRGATFVKGGNERTANDWLNECDKLRRVMKRDKSDCSERVKIAIIDSGLNDTVKNRYIAQNQTFFEDFTGKTGNDSWHGTCCAKIISDIYEEAIFFIARIFENDDADEIDGPNRMAKAIDWAISPPNRVDIISISAGFRNYSRELSEAVTRANALGVLVIAAAANWSNTETVAYPAKHRHAAMCIYSTNLGNQSSRFNPEPRKNAFNVAVLGEGFDHPDQKRGGEQMSGTSMATAAAVGLAASIIDFSRHEDNRSHISRSQDVGRLQGMLSIFEFISKPAGPLSYVAPSGLLPPEQGSTREEDRQRIRVVLSLAMENAD